jgi:hypothetical protein
MAVHLMPIKAAVSCVRTDVCHRVSVQSMASSSPFHPTKEKEYESFGAMGLREGVMVREYPADLSWQTSGLRGNIDSSFRRRH